MFRRFAPRRRLTLATIWLWSWLRSPWLAILTGIIGVTLVIAVWRLPQLPGQFVDEHAAAANWLLTTSTAYGIWGNFFLALGLFDVLRSPLLYLLLALIIPTLATQLADQAGALRQFRDVQTLDLGRASKVEDEVLPLSAARPLFRTRFMLSAAVPTVADGLERLVQASFPQVETTQVAIADAGEEAATEVRIRGLHRPIVQYLRPLLMIGLLIAVAGAWTALTFGWQVTVPPLAPDATYRSANRDLVLRYTVPATNTAAAKLGVSLQGASMTLPIDDATRRQLGTATVQVRPAYPAILIATTTTESRITLPGDTTRRAQVGLVLPDPGSEESILIPDQGIGLRVVRRADSDGFVLELYRSDTVEPVYRDDLTPSGMRTIPFGPMDPGLVVYAMPGLQVDVRHLPGLYLVTLGVVLAFVGALAFLRPSAFVLAQVAPWTTGYTVVTLQADQEATVTLLRQAIEGKSSEVVEASSSDDSAQPSPPQSTPEGAA